MGSPCALHLYGDSPAEGEAAARAAMGEVARLERKFSRYLDDSLAARINRRAGDPDGIEVDEETAGLLDYAATSYQQSDGLFDITSGILRRAWDFKAARLPSPGEIEALLPRLGWDKVTWKRPRLVLPVEGMEVDFGGYVKEYAADRVAALLGRHGIRHGLVDLGGDLCAVGPHPDGEAWQVGIRDPRRPESAVASVGLASGGLASSGDYERFMVVEGRRYGHILNPKTGWPVDGLASVTVVASHCLVAGTASTIGMLRGGLDGPAWLDRLGLPNLRMDRGGELTGSLAPRA